MHDRGEIDDDDLDPLDLPEDLEDGPEALDASEDEGDATDHALIRRAQTGDGDAFADLVRRHEGRAFRVARNMLPNDEDARDLAQEAFLRVYRNLERFDFEHGFTTWLYRIVTNLAIDHLRKRRPAVSTASQVPPGEEERELDLPDPHEELPSDRMESEETAREVHACLETLAPHFQSVLVLRELEGLACTEIAEIVGATHVTVRWRLHRGRKLFQEEWERRQRLAEKKSRGASLPDRRSPDHGANTRETPRVEGSVPKGAKGDRGDS